MNSTLQKAIEDVYEAFRDVPKPAKIDGCPCCFNDEDIRVALSKPLRDLSGDEMSSYASSVFLTVGAVEDFLYFLPRILEILASDHSWWPDPEIVARAIHNSGFHSWPLPRRQAVLQYFDEVIGELLATDGPGWELDSWVCALGRLHLDLAPFLARIAANGPRLLEWYQANSQELKDGRLANGFWNDAPEEAREVVDWFRCEETQKVIAVQSGLQ